jgi:hypothetical protein
MLPPVDKFTDVEIAFIASLKEEAALDWATIAEKFNKKFRKDKSLDSVKKGYQRNRDRLSNPNNYVKLLKDTARTRKANSFNSTDLKTILEEWNNREDILDAIQGAAKGLLKVFAKPLNLPKPGKSAKGMTLELLISDVHVGKLTKTFNHEVLVRRLKQVSDTTIKEMQRAAVHYRIDRVILAFIGDLIESATMHGVESARGCEFGNSRQVEEALKQMFHLIVAPICKAAEQLGATVDCVGVTGNHDRTEEHRTFNSPGEENVTWIIYKAMEEFSKLAGLKATWHIPAEPFQYMEIYGEGVVYEHYDNVKGSNKAVGIEGLLSKRINQIKKPVVFIRGGHFHEPMETGIGKIVINGNVPGNDSFSTVLGFDCEPSQTLNFYIERDRSDSIKRQTSFYKRFLIQLD